MAPCSPSMSHQHNWSPRDRDFLVACWTTVKIKVPWWGPYSMLCCCGASHRGVQADRSFPKLDSQILDSHTVASLKTNMVHQNGNHNVWKPFHVFYWKFQNNVYNWKLKLKTLIHRGHSTYVTTFRQLQRVSLDWHWVYGFGCGCARCLQGITTQKEVDGELHQ